MGLLESIRSMRDYFDYALLATANQSADADDPDTLQGHRPFGPEMTPRGLPADLPVFSTTGYRHRPHAAVNAYGDVTMIYCPRAEFSAVVAFYEEELLARRWHISDVRDDRADLYRARRFEVQKGTRQGSVAVEETLEELWPVERRVVTVSIDIPRWH